jgi:hypothetical protein
VARESEKAEKGGRILLLGELLEASSKIIRCVPFVFSPFVFVNGQGVGDGQSTVYVVLLLLPPPLLRRGRRWFGGGLAGAAAGGRLDRRGRLADFAGWAARYVFTPRESIAGHAKGASDPHDGGERWLTNAKAVVVDRSKRYAAQFRQLCFTEAGTLA